LISGHVARSEGYEKFIKFMVRKREGKSHSGDAGVDGRIILERILEKQCGRLRIGFIWLRIGSSGGLLWTR